MRTYCLNLNACDSMLPSTDPEFQFNIEGIRNGFSIIDYFPEFTEALCCDNYRSALSNTIKVENVIKSEIRNGNYVITKIKPLIISALGCVPKGSNSVRLIHDASMPSKHSINNFVNEKSCSYMDLRHACKLIKHNNFLCKVDIKMLIEVCVFANQISSLQVCIGNLRAIQNLHIFMIQNSLSEPQNRLVFFHLCPVLIVEL